MRIDRRTFIKTTGGIALVSAARSLTSFAAEVQEEQKKKTRVAVFFAEGFPVEHGVPFTKSMLEEALSGFTVLFLTADAMRSRLSVSDFDLLITPYGSAFPKQATNALFRYLRDGGNWVNLGGIPLGVPVRKTETGWEKDTLQTAYHKTLGITQAFPVFPRPNSPFIANEDVDRATELQSEFNAEEVFELYVRLTSTKDFPPEDGSAGARDAVLRPVVWLSNEGQKVAAPFIELDWIQGDYAGGRWMLANFRGTISTKAIRWLVERGLQGSAEFVARPSYACYRQSEVPSFAIQLRRPRGGVERIIDGKCSVEVVDERGSTVGRASESLVGVGTLAAATVQTPFQRPLKSGFFRVTVKQRITLSASGRSTLESYTTGFWIYERKLLDGGKRLTADGVYFLRDAKPYPVTGTTYMGSDVHRKFLFEPNAYLWQRDFAAMKAAGINMVRTGIWTGWKNYMLDVGAPTEAALRAMDAFLMTARQHDIPIIFTFFAFLPETWGGENAYLDPRSVNAQREFITIFAQRYREANDLTWDLINEPSFCNPQYLWNCRPNYDRYEQAAWAAWLKRRHPSESAEESESLLRDEYRATTEESLALPPLKDFEDVNIFEQRRPIKVIDYRLFAQDMFRQWVEEMTKAIRSNGNPNQLITVGQDEAGTNDSPNNQFLTDAVDFTCIHNWWLNGDLVWDNVMTKVPGKPNLVEETGVMFYEKMDGRAWRTEEDVRNLLEQKVAISFAAGGAGFIEWIWNSNPYMKSDNEAAIGLHRADGTSKPELAAIVDFARFFRENRGWMKGRREEEVFLVIPHSQMFSTRNLATEATQRCVRVMTEEFGLLPAAVSEYALDRVRNIPKVVIVPSPRTFNEKAWQRLIELATKGSTVLVSGPIDADDHWIPISRSVQLGFPCKSRPVAEEEVVSMEDGSYHTRFLRVKTQRVEKGVSQEDRPENVVTIPQGKGTIIWSLIPVELADNDDPTIALYNYGLRKAGVAATFVREQKDHSVLVLPAVYEDSVLYTAVSRADRDTDLKLTHHPSNTEILMHVLAGRTALVFVERATGKVLSRLP